MKIFKICLSIIFIVMTALIVWHPVCAAPFISAMLYIPGVGFSTFAKKAGSTVASKNHYGGYLRKLVKPINPKSASQTAQRTLLRSLAQSWKGLTQAQVLSWNAIGPQLSKSNRLGQKIHPTGEAAYMSANLNISVNEGTPITDAPSLDANDVPFLADVVITIVSGVISMAYTPGSVATNMIEVAASGAMSSGRTYNSNFRKIISFAGNTVSPKVLTTAWTALFGTAPVAGQVVFFRYRVVDTLSGFATGWEKVRVIAS